MWFVRKLHLLKEIEKIMLGVYNRTHPVYNILSNVASYKWNFWKRQPLLNITLNLSFCAVVVVLSSVCHEQGVRHELYLCGKFCQCQMKIVRFVTPRRACVTPRTRKTTRQQLNFKITILAKVQPCWCSAIHSSLFRDILFFMPLRCRQSFALLHEKIMYVSNM